MEAFFLSQAMPADFKRLFECQVAAFGKDPFLDIIYPASTVDENVKRQRSMLELDWRSVYLKIEDVRTGEIVAAVYGAFATTMRSSMETWRLIGLGQSLEKKEHMLSICSMRSSVAGDGEYRRAIYVSICGYTSDCRPTNGLI
jgi:hypothetical protein